MKIIFIVASTESLTAAGVRIRYKRLEPFFNRENCSIQIIALQDISELLLKDADVVILSKIFTSDFIISLCRVFKVKVGIDLFDDYFSDKKLRYSEDLVPGLNLSHSCRLHDCSTDRMKAIASEYFQGDLVHKMIPKPLMLILVRPSSYWTKN